MKLHVPIKPHTFKISYQASHIARICHSPFSIIHLKFIILPDIPNYNKINIKSQNCKICQIAYYYYNDLKYIIIFPHQKRDSLRIVYWGNCCNPEIKTHSIYGLCFFYFLIELNFFRWPV